MFKKLALVVPAITLGFVGVAYGTETPIDDAVGEITGIVDGLTDGLMDIVGPILLLGGGIFVVFFGYSVLKRLVKGAK